ncbi:hypothetical protein [Myxococcus sp. CA039A]|uniref:hypothetical protein n=1 Tax=Myxococcus sp. CA039A TaxID=2741737 RepID=UPI00157B5B86|nr:hypothetical protein [Myxococcus sp. CA039A]NTX55888.1 hypothetical protein [Myxococcus sp. CA039A]
MNTVTSQKQDAISSSPEGFVATEERARERWAPVDAAILIVGAFVTVALSVRLLPMLVDDSFIYLRIASNIGSGQGWSYNPGEVGNAATSTTFTLLVTALGAVMGYSEWTLATAYGLSLYALAALQFIAWRREGRARALVLAVGAAGGMRMLDSFGMEAALLMAFVSATALSYRARGDAPLTGVLAGLTALTRPEGIFVLGLLGLIELVTRRRLAWRSALTAALVAVPWLVFARWYFGAAVSQTGEVKALQRHLGWWATQPDFIVYFVKQARFPWLTLPLAAGGIWLALRDVKQGNSFAVLCIGFGVAQVVGYQLLDAPTGYHWYCVPGNVAVDLSILLLGSWVVTTVARRLALSPILTAGATVLLLVPMVRLGMVPVSRLPAEYRLAGEYRAVGEWVRAHGEPGDTLAATEIGYLGWYSGLRILDIHGLVHPSALPWLRQHNLHWWWDAGERPQYIVIHEPPWHGEPGSTDSWPAPLSAGFFRQYRKAFRTESLHVFELGLPTQ